MLANFCWFFSFLFQVSIGFLSEWCGVVWFLLCWQVFCSFLLSSLLFFFFSSVWLFGVGVVWCGSYCIGIFFCSFLLSSLLFFSFQVLVGLVSDWCGVVFVVLICFCSFELSLCLFFKF